MWQLPEGAAGSSVPALERAGNLNRDGLSLSCQAYDRIPFQPPFPTELIPLSHYHALGQPEDLREASEVIL